VLHTKFSGDQIAKNEMGIACDTYGGEERCILVGKHDEKRPLGRPSILTLLE